MRRALATAALLLWPAAQAQAQAQAEASDTHIGRWAATEAACGGIGGTADTAPLIATAGNLRWYPAACRIGSMYRIGPVVHVVARCLGGESDVAVRLEVGRDRLRVHWAGLEPRELRRCRAGSL